MKSFLATLLLSQGVPMILAGDEFGRTQNGNNNAYCQDRPVSWIDWHLSEEAKSLFQYTRELIALRHTYPELRRDKFLTKRDVTWLRPDGEPMTLADWDAPDTRALGFTLGDLRVLMNAGSEAISFTVGNEIVVVQPYELICAERGHG
jgi:glycogen operon protein